MGRIAGCLVGLMSLGCAAVERIEPGLFRSAQDLDLAARTKQIARDPESFIRFVAEQCQGLDQYTLTLTRQERRGLGLFRRLRAPERIACWFRRSPFSVRMKWLDDDVKYGSSTYVEGEVDDHVRFVPRHGFLGLPPGVIRVAVGVAVAWGESRHAVTDFGLERLMEQTLEMLEIAGERARVEYLGITTVGGIERPVYHLRIEVPASQSDAPIMDLFVDVANDLPLCTRLLLRSGELDTAYIYDAVDLDVTLTDDDFLLEQERSAVARKRAKDE